MFSKLNLRYLPGFELWADAHRSEVKRSQRPAWAFSEGGLHGTKACAAASQGLHAQETPRLRHVFRELWGCSSSRLFLQFWRCGIGSRQM